MTDWDFSKIDEKRNVCEELGFIPWAFGLPAAGFERAWRYLRDERGFEAPYGPTTAEQGHKRFMGSFPEHECLWNGASWPFATTQTLNALANVLKDQKQEWVTWQDFFTLFSRYTHSHYRTDSRGNRINWLDENLDPFTGEWLSRRILKDWGWREDKGGYERGKDYNHSAYADLIIRRIFGVEPQKDKTVHIRPVFPDDWEYCRLSRLFCQGREYAICMDRSGKRYGKKGIQIWCDGKQIQPG